MSAPLVVALGSPHGDDRVGWEALERLSRSADCPGHVRCVRLDSPAGLPVQLPGAGPLILVDAVRSGAAPGTVQRLSWPEDAERWPAAAALSSHGMGLAQALELAAALDLLPARVTVFAVEAASVTPGQPLSPAVAGALPALIASLRAELTRALPETARNGPVAAAASPRTMR